MTIKNPILKTLFMALIVLTLANCDNSRVKPVDDNVNQDPIARLLEQANNLPSPQSEQLMLQAVAQLRENNRVKEAERILNAIDANLLPGSIKADFILETARFALINQDTALAHRPLATDQMQLLSISPTLPVEKQNEISLLRAEMYEYQGEFFLAAQERIFVAPMLNEEQRNNNQEAIWQDLTAMPTGMLETLSKNAGHEEMRGWFELGWLYKAYQDDMDNQIQQLRDWRQRYPSHPAAIEMPQSLAILTELILKRPTQIAVLLPNKGRYWPAARAIRNGFMAAHYAAMETRGNQRDEETPLVIRFYDSSTGEIFRNNYQKAIDEGAQLIIGPLQKENVKTLQQQQSLTVPTLALNYGIPNWENPTNLFQFGLSAEEEARQVAERAWSLEFENAGILYPEGEWGERVYNAFAEHWTSLNGQVLASAAYSKNNTISNAIKQMLLIEQSETRAVEFRRITGIKPEFQPRRRQDIDFVFVFASPKQARQIKPLFDFHYAADVPLMASSRIYEGKTNPDLDKDLNGMAFCDIPWVFGEASKAKAMLEEAWPKADYRYNRLYALGVDSYRLHSRLQLFTAVDGAKFFGATGSLSLSNENIITRTLTWAHFKSGIAKQVPHVQRASDGEQTERDKQQERDERQEFPNAPPALGTQSAPPPWTNHGASSKALSGI
ncbi:MAG: penicillin-binding protein activator [Pseudomonadales bacterium]|nr:penicillin-binding protein activator [Pseudomonadales bacterium]